MLNKIYNENHLITTQRMPDCYVDCIITSPPYDKLRNYQGSKFDFYKIAPELYRILKKGGVLVWVVNDSVVKGSETGTCLKQALHFMNIGFNLHDTMIYNKDNPVPVGGSNRYYQAFEYMFVFSKGAPAIFNPIKRKRRNKYNDKRTERVKGFNRDVDGKFIKKKVSLTGDVKINNVWTYTVGGGNSVDYGIKHSAAFPLELAKDHIKSWTNENAIVYDPMMGSGTVAKACKELNRNFIGSEMSKIIYKENELDKL